MVVLFWVGGIGLAATAVPAVLFYALHLATGEQVPMRRARALFRWAQVIGLGTFDIAIFTRVVQGIIAVW